MKNSIFIGLFTMIFIAVPIFWSCSNSPKYKEVKSSSKDIPEENIELDDVSTENKVKDIKFYSSDDFAFALPIIKQKIQEFSEIITYLNKDGLSEELKQHGHQFLTKFLVDNDSIKADNTLIGLTVDRIDLIKVNNVNVPFYEIQTETIFKNSKGITIKKEIHLLLKIVQSDFAYEISDIKIKSIKDL